MQTERPTPRASIVIPTRNGGSVWRDTLLAILRQQVDCSFELIVIDSASTDGTPELAERLFADPRTNPHHIPLQLVRIALGEFGHGRTRNLGARMACGTYVVYLSQDATPVGDRWLAGFLQPFADLRIVGAFCRQVPLPEVRLPERFILETTYPPGSSVRTRDSLASRDAGYILFSNAASAIRREALLATPFDETVMMCEDTHWAVQVLQAGHRIAYVADAEVAHSHNYTLHAIFSRNFDYAVALEGLPGSMGLRSYLHYLRREVAFLARHNGVAALPWTAAFEAARCLGYVLGARQRRLPTWLVRRISGYPQWFVREGSTDRAGEHTGDPVLRGGRGADDRGSGTDRKHRDHLLQLRALPRRGGRQRACADAPRRRSDHRKRWIHGRYPDLDFSHSGGVGGGVHEAGEEVAGGEGGVDRIGLSAAIPGGPEGAAD